MSFVFIAAMVQCWRLEQLFGGKVFRRWNSRRERAEEESPLDFSRSDDCCLKVLETLAERSRVWRSRKRRMFPRSSVMLRTLDAANTVVAVSIVGISCGLAILVGGRRQMKRTVRGVLERLESVVSISLILWIH